MVKVTTQVSAHDLPQVVKDLLASREKAREGRDYAQSDKLRQEIASHGYVVNDISSGYEILKIGDKDKKAAKNYLVLFGSGENAPSSVEIYRQLFFKLQKRDLKISLITTPAGFQPNVEYVYAEIKDFLLQGLPDFNLDIQIVFANTHTDCNDEKIVAQLDGSDIIFTGPGSPSYAASTLRYSRLAGKISDMVKNGCSLILASAATVAFSHYCLPVYEIYKVGESLHWERGLDFYDSVWQRATIIPHFNNNEGGEHLDTSHCYVGRDRFAQLQKMLPANEWIMGIDEHTAYIIDIDTQETSVMGKGGITNL